MENIDKELKETMFTRDKILHTIGSSVGIIFNKEEQKLYDLSVGNSVNITLKKNNKINK
jgi:hypothetical protein